MSCCGPFVSGLLGCGCYCAYNILIIWCLRPHSRQSVSTGDRWTLRHGEPRSQVPGCCISEKSTNPGKRMKKGWENSRKIRMWHSWKPGFRVEHSLKKNHIDQRGSLFWCFESSDHKQDRVKNPRIIARLGEKMCNRIPWCWTERAMEIERSTRWQIGAMFSFLIVCR